MKILSKLLSYTMIASFIAIGYSCSDDDNSDDNKTSDYFYYADHSYLIVKELKTWTDAAADAVSKGGYLVEIGSKAEQDVVYQGIVDAGISATYVSVPDGGGTAYIWIGATDRANEGGWLWNGKNSQSGGTSFWEGKANGYAVNQSYYNWGGKASGTLNEPDNFTDSEVSPNGQNAAAIGLAKWPTGTSVELGKAGEWNDIAETNKIYYIIEFDTTK